MATASVLSSPFSVAWEEGQGGRVYPAQCLLAWGHTWNSSTRDRSTVARPQVWAANSSTWKALALDTTCPETNACSRWGTSTAGWSDLQGVGGAEGCGLAITALALYTHEVGKDPLRVGALFQQLLQWEGHGRGGI